MPEVPSTMVLWPLSGDSTPIASAIALIGGMDRWSLARRTGTVLIDLMSAVASVTRPEKLRP